jgi:hypothetical protein
VLSDGFKPVPTGETKVPTFMLVAVRTMETLGIIGFVFMLWWFVIRPWRKDRHVTWDGMFFIAVMLLYWQDSLPNYANYGFTYNAAVVNWGSWNNWIPGWVAPNGARFAEAPLAFGTWYCYGIFGYVLLANYLMRKAKVRWPSLGTVGLIGALFCASLLIDILTELTYLRLGLYTYGGSIEGLTFFSGHYYQIPVYEPILWSTFWTAIVAFRWYRNDKGESIAERGIDRVGIGRKGRTCLRFLAILGVTNVIFLGFNLGWVFVGGLNVGRWPRDVQQRSYFTNGLCGEGTSYACPGPNVPHFRRGSLTIDPEGNVVVPPGVEPLVPVPRAK